MIGFDSKRKYFYARGTYPLKKLKGLHDVLSMRFYPPGSTYANTKLKHFPKRNKDRVMTTSRGRPLPRLTHKQAVRLGSRIDEQIRRLVEAATGNAKVLRKWVTGKRVTIEDTLEKGTTLPERPVKRLHVFAAAAITKLMDNNWIPTRCQLPVGSPDHGIATAVDIECRHASIKGKMAVIELKTGYDATWNSHTGQKLKKPLESLLDTNEHKAHLQALCTAMLYKHSEQAKQPPDVFVLRVSKLTGATLSPVNDTMRNNAQQIARVMCAVPQAVTSSSAYNACSRFP